MRQYGMGLVIVQGTSMAPSLRPGDEYIMRNGVHNFQRGDVVVVNDGLGGRAVKRIVGLGQYFVMGDNRQASTDSRYYGPVGVSQLYGRVLVAMQ